MNYLDADLNYIPVLTHEFCYMYCLKTCWWPCKRFSHCNKSTRSQQQTLQQGFAITQSRHLAGQWLTTIGGYLMPPIMLLIGLVSSLLSDT
ncbi:M50 family metallopeptidase [Staphylococcus aureus]